MHIPPPGSHRLLVLLFRPLHGGVGHDSATFSRPWRHTNGDRHSLRRYGDGVPRSRSIFPHYCTPFSRTALGGAECGSFTRRSDKVRPALETAIMYSHNLQSSVDHKRRKLGTRSTSYVLISLFRDSILTSRIARLRVYLRVVLSLSRFPTSTKALSYRRPVSYFWTLRRPSKCCRHG
jgi:hypothetical protein